MAFQRYFYLSLDFFQFLEVNGLHIGAHVSLKSDRFLLTCCNFMVNSVLLIHFKILVLTQALEKNSISLNHTLRHFSLQMKCSHIMCSKFESGISPPFSAALCVLTTTKLGIPF